MHSERSACTSTLEGTKTRIGSAPVNGASLLAALAYADLFDYPLDASEVALYQVGTSLSIAEVQAWLDGEARSGHAISHVDGYYCLVGRENTVPERRLRTVTSAKIWRRARLYINWLARLPFVRMVAVTGSLAVNNISTRPDIDLLVVTQPGRVWICRRWLVIFVRLVRLFGDELCPNYIISSHDLALEQKDLFTSHELAQMVPLYGPAIYKKLLSNNRWAQEYLPAAFEGTGYRVPVSPFRRGLLRRRVESLLARGWFDRWEAWEMYRLQEKLRAYVGSTVEVICTPYQCKGHTSFHREAIMSRYRAKLEDLHLGNILGSIDNIESISG